MPNKLKTISGAECINNLCKNFKGEVVSQKGSHIKIKFSDGRKVIFPNHKELNRFTLKGILVSIDSSLQDFFDKI